MKINMTMIKKIKIPNDRPTTIWLIIAAAVILTILASAIFFLINIARDIEIVSTKTESNNVLLSNIENINSLNENINTLQTNADLLRLIANPNDTVFDVIFNAMPIEEDTIALAAMIQDNIFNGTGVKIERVVVGDGKKNTSEIDINFTISGDLSQIIAAGKRLENSIRPIVIKSISLYAVNGEFKVNFIATTFFSSATSFVINEKELAGEKIPIVKPVSPEITKPNPKIFGEKAINPKAWKQKGVSDGSDT